MQYFTAAQTACRSSSDATANSGHRPSDVHEPGTYVGVTAPPRLCTRPRNILMHAVRALLTDCTPQITLPSHSRYNAHPYVGVTSPPLLCARNILLHAVRTQAREHGYRNIMHSLAGTNILRRQGICTKEGKRKRRFKSDCRVSVQRLGRLHP